MKAQAISPRLETYSQLSKLVVGFNILDCTIAGRVNHLKDLKRRLKRQQKTLEKCELKGWDAQPNLESIQKIEKCITALSA